MKYTKPEVIRVADPINMIQTNTHKPDPPTDSCGHPGTTAAYEADE
jgi:hypothetical protein